MNKRKSYLNRVKTTKFACSLNKRSHTIQKRGSAARLYQQAGFVYKQTTLAKHIRVQLFRVGKAQYFAVD